MTFSTAETEILNRFLDKTRIAGGAKPGYNLRRGAIHAGSTDGIAAAGLAAATDEGLASLVEKGLLVSNEGGDRFVLTEAGVEALSVDRV